MNLTARMVDHRPPGTGEHQRLSELPLGASATIAGLEAHLDAATARRLFDLGFTRGTTVTPLRRTPLGGPRIYRIGDYELALRTAQARTILLAQAA